MMRRVFRIPFTRGHIDREIDDELAFHIETRTRRLIAAGWSADAARSEAMRQFGDVASVRASCVELDQERERAMHRANLIAELRQDVAFAVRTLRRNFAFTVLVVGALAVGIGANTAIFTLVDAVLVAKLPVSHPEALVAIGNTSRVGGISTGFPQTNLISYPLYKDLRDRNQSFSGLLASGRSDRLDVRVDDNDAELEHPRGRFVSGNYFSLLGVSPLLGRTFDARVDDVPGGSPVITISYAYWMRRFHGAPDVVGRQILVNGIKMAIVGVTRPGFTGEIVGLSNDVWLPIAMVDVLKPNARRLDDRLVNWLLLLGRLKPGATLARAERELQTLMQQSIVANSTPTTGRAFLEGKPKYYVSSGTRGFSRIRELFRAPLLTLMIGVGLLLCIICANVANLLLARSIARGRELSVRLALGAGRGRLVRQLLTESAVLATIGAACGLAVAWWASRGLVVLAAAGIPFAVDLSLDMRILAFTAAISVGAVLIFGLAPALRASRLDLASSIRAAAPSLMASGQGRRSRRFPLGTALISAQVALSIVLLVGAGMLVRSLRNVESQDVGVDRDHLVILELDINTPGYTRVRLGNLAHALRDRIAAIPGVAAVTYSENGLFSGTDNGTTIEIPGFVAHEVSDTLVGYDNVGPGFAHAVGARIVDGRDILASDEGKAPRTALVNESFARFFFAGQRAVGKFVHVNDSIAIQIAGVIGDVRDHDLSGQIERRMYLPFVHTDTQPGQWGQPGTMRMEIRAAGAPTSIVQPVRRAVVATDPLLPISSIDPLVTLMSESISQQRLLAQLATGYGVLALVLAAIGLYGVMTYAISRRTNEIGLRVALGADRGQIVAMVLRDALRLVAAGVVIGVPLALAAARLLEAQLHGVSVGDPYSFGLAVIVLTAAAIAAALVPARRAANVAPLVALRAE
jgi:putative ABC transport system permease protein